MSASLHITVFKWLRELKIPVSKSYLKEQLFSHPDYPSVLSITDTLNDLGIENAAVQIEKEQLAELPSPFIAHLNGNGGEFVVVNGIDRLENRVTNFFKRWSSIVIAAEKPERWEHKQNSEWLKKENANQLVLITVLSVLVMLIFLSMAISFSLLFTGLLLIATAGIFISWMIMSKDLGIDNKIADELCGANADCNSVIHSKKGKPPFNVNWSDAGVIYFSFLLIILLIGSFDNSLPGIYQFLSLLALAAIPVTIISVYYQWRIIKKWCPLCLFTSLLLWLQFFLLLPVGLGISKKWFEQHIH
jgi:uncharacterized membrane protein